MNAIFELFSMMRNLTSQLSTSPEGRADVAPRHVNAPQGAQSHGGNSLSASLLSAIMLLCSLFSAQTASAQDPEFSQTYQAPLYLSPSFTGLTNGTRFGFNYRNQWPGVGSAYQNYAFSADYFFNHFNSGLGLLWVCDNAGKGLMMDHLVSLLYAYEFAIAKDLFLRPGLAFDFKQRSIDQTKMITFSDIDADGNIVPGNGTGMEIERTRIARFDASVSCMVYNDDFWGGITFDHLLQPDVSFTDSKDKIGLKTTVYGGYRLTYQPSYRGSEPKTVTLSVTYQHQYQFNQLMVGASWYYYPIEVGCSYRGLFFKVAGEISNRDAVIPNLGVNIGPFRLGYSYDLTVSQFSSFGNGAHEISLIYRLIPDDVRRRSYKMKPVPCSEPIMGYSYSGSGSGKRKSATRRGIHR